MAAVRRFFARRQRPHERGATLVEYSLFLTGVVVVSLGALGYLTEQSEDQIDNSADCVSERPPPPSCQVRAITTTTSTTTPDASTTTASDIPSSTTTTIPPAAQASTIGYSADSTVTPWTITPTVVITSEGNPVAGATITFQFTWFAPESNQVTTGTCVTDGTGTCTATFPAAYTDATAVQITVASINSDPPVPAGELPAPITVPRP